VSGLRWSGARVPNPPPLLRNRWDPRRLQGSQRDEGEDGVCHSRGELLIVVPANPPLPPGPDRPAAPGIAMVDVLGRAGVQYVCLGNHPRAADEGPRVCVCVWNRRPSGRSGQSGQGPEGESVLREKSPLPPLERQVRGMHPTREPLALPAETFF